MWVITDGRRFVMKDNQGLTSDINKAMKFATSDKASNFMCNMKRTYKSYSWQVIAVNDAKKENKKIENKKEMPASKYNENDSITVFEHDGFSWESNVSSIETFFGQLDTYKNTLEREERRIERELCDIRHAIEFAVRANAVEGNSLFRKIRDKLQERRYVKDELARVSIIQDSTLDDIHNGRVSRRLSGMEDRAYAPRELPELFKARYIVM